MTFFIQPYRARRAIRRWAEQPSDYEYYSLGLNVREEEDAYVLTAFVPGLKAEDLSVQTVENAVTIEGEYKFEENGYLLNELPHGNFRRVLRLPNEIESEKAEAKIVDGVLTLTLPKAESARPKKINVKVN